MRRFLFLGERPSPKALTMGVRWEDGRLAAKQLFDGLQANGIDPADHRFDNVFLPVIDGSPRVKPWLKRTLMRAARRGETLVAMGSLVSGVLARLGVDHIAVVHPAARGRIRKKTRYAAHLKERLCPTN